MPGWPQPRRYAHMAGEDVGPRAWPLPRCPGGDVSAVGGGWRAPGGRERRMNNSLTFPLHVWVNISLFTINPREIFHPSKWNKGYVSRET